MFDCEAYVQLGQTKIWCMIESHDSDQRHKATFDDNLGQEVELTWS